MQHSYQPRVEKDTEPSNFTSFHWRFLQVHLSELVQVKDCKSLYAGSSPAVDSKLPCRIAVITFGFDPKNRVSTTLRATNIIFMKKYNYDEDKVRDAVSKSTTYTEVLEHLGIPVRGGNNATIKRVVEGMGLNVSHFTGRRKNTVYHKDIPLEEYINGGRKIKSSKLLVKLIKAGVKHVVLWIGMTNLSFCTFIIVTEILTIIV